MLSREAGWAVATGPRAGASMKTGIVGAPAAASRGAKFRHSPQTW